MEYLTNLLTGNLTSSMRIWAALAPTLVIAAYGLIALIAYLIRTSIKGEFHDADLESKSDSVLFGNRFRVFILWGLDPFWRVIVRIGIPPDAITTLSVLISFGAAVAFAAGRFTLGGWLYLLSGTLDVVDGRLARKTGKDSPRGAALDSILDRYSDSAVLIGLGWYYRDHWMLMVVMLTLAGSLLVPYARAKGESLGLNLKFGLMQRAERVFYLGVLTALSPILSVILWPEDPKPIHLLAAIGLVLLAISTHITAAQRLLFILDKLDGPANVNPPPKVKGGLLTRNLIAAGVATGADFALVWFLVTHFELGAALATGIGCVLGGAINLFLNRVWTFRSDGPKGPEALRYVFVSTSSAFLNAAGVAVLLLLPSVPYQIAWLAVRVAVFLTWNYPMHRDYVFVRVSHSDEQQPALHNA